MKKSTEKYGFGINYIYKFKDFQFTIKLIFEKLLVEWEIIRFIDFFKKNYLFLYEIRIAWWKIEKNYYLILILKKIFII